MLGSNNVISTYRMVVTNGKETYSGTATNASLDCYIEHSKPEVAIMFENTPAYEIFSCFIDGNIDVKISDKVVDAQGNVYVVKDVKEYDNNTDILDLTEITIFKKYTLADCPIITSITPSATAILETQAVVWTFVVSHSTASEITLMTYDIDWGDSTSHSTGTCAASFLKSHNYNTAGVYTGSITITDSKGNSITQALNTITVTP